MGYKGVERRKHPRINVNFIVSYRILDQEEDNDLSQTKNISQGGMLLTTNRHFDSGVMLKMFIRLPLVKDKLVLIGRVIESKEVVKGIIYETRIVFFNLEEQVNKILKQTVDTFLNQKNRR